MLLQEDLKRQVLRLLIQEEGMGKHRRGSLELGHLVSKDRALSILSYLPLRSR